MNNKQMIRVFLMSCVVAGGCAELAPDDAAPGAGGKSDGVAYDVSYRGEGFAAYEGRDVHVALTVGWVHSAPVAHDTATITNGAFEFQFPDAVRADFDVTLYIDVDRDGQCSSGDVHWRELFADTSGDVALRATPEEIEPDADYHCARFAE